MAVGLDLDIRPARSEDILSIVCLLADDPLGATREDASEPLLEDYRLAFEAIILDCRTKLVVAECAEAGILGCLQLTTIPGLSHRGLTRALIEDVRVDARFRGKGIGRQMLEWAIGEAQRSGCRMVQLFVHETRSDARGFYTGLGFEQVHAGLRLRLP